MSVLTDCFCSHATQQSLPPLDTVSNIFATSGSNVDGLIDFQFSRELDTNDTLQDVTLDVPRVWIWAIGNIDGGILQHSATTRGLLNSGIPITLMECEGMNPDKVKCIS